MLVVRNSFLAKPGQASKLAAQIKDAATAANLTNARVMTDLTGDFNRVIFEFEAASLTKFEARLKEYMTNTAFREKMQGYTEHWTTGSREIFQVA